MACLQNGTTLLNNNNLSSFKHNIMKYDETHHQNAWSNTSQLNSFLNKNCQLPFRNNYTKDKVQSDLFNKEEVYPCVRSDLLPVKNENDDRSYDTIKPCEGSSVIQQQNNRSESSKLITPKTEPVRLKNEQCHFLKRESSSEKADEPSWLASEKMEAVPGYREANQSYEKERNESLYQKEHPSDPMMMNPEEEPEEPSHHARRPMNAFLIFCKRHRTVVKNRYPHLENRAVTKILGEWWAALETEEKSSYTELARQYKNAFFSANPNFKWYKLPAPPLRTLNTRPGNTVKPPPSKQPSLAEIEEKPQQLFTPGKLADETQLGSITSLIQSDSHSTHTTVKSPTSLNPASLSASASASASKPSDHKSEEEYSNYLLSPPLTNDVQMCQPPKPFKKRMLHQHKDNKSIIRNIFCTKDTQDNKPDESLFDSSLLERALENFVDTVDSEDVTCNNNNNSNLTQQELINKVVDHMCSSKSESCDSEDKDEFDCNSCSENQVQEPRKSVRSCKGLRYAKFMAEGKLFVNKRNKKQHPHKVPKPSFTPSDKVPRNPESIELNETIKKLTERTLGLPKAATDLQEFQEFQEEDSPDAEDHLREESAKKMFRAADFNLDEKIEALPSLSLDKFQQKKRENKKRKFLRATAKLKETADQQKKVSAAEAARFECDKSAASLIGSRKRKPRKQSITRLDPQPLSPTGSSAKKQKEHSATTSTELDLFGLATLAEVAAKKARIDQK